MKSNTMQWFFTNDKGEKVAEPYERFQWEVFFKDGSSLKQYDEEGVYHPFREIKWNNVESFVVADAENGNVQISIPYDETLQIFFFRRDRVVIEVGTQKVKGKITVPVFGWKSRENASTCYFYILAIDGRVHHIVSDHDVALSIPNFN